MKPVDQTIFSGESITIVGNCFQACVASLLELPIQSVPHFIQIGIDEGNDWFDVFDDWLNDRNMFSVEICLKDKTNILAISSNQYCIVSGLSPRNIMHSVIGKTSKFRRDSGIELIHDPHPSRDFFVEDPTWVMFIGKN